jgi:hypothetical protein
MGIHERVLREGMKLAGGEYRIDFVSKYRAFFELWTEESYAYSGAA